MKLLTQEKQDELNNQLTTALFAHDWETVKSLIKSGADVNQMDSFHRTPILLASEFADVETVDFLIKNGADICITDFEAKSPVHYAARNSDNAVLKYWVNHTALPVDKKSHQNETPLLEAAKADLELNAALLVEYGADPSIKTHFGESPVSIASQKKNGRLLKIMLPYVDDVNLTNGDTNTLLINAVNASNYDAAQLLIRAGADVNMPNHAGITPLIAALSVQDKPLMMLCLTNGARVNQPDKYGSTPILRAAVVNDPSFVEILHMYGANVEHEDKYGYTPLLEAALSGSYQTVQALLNLGASPYRMNADGKTPEQLYREKTGVELNVSLARQGISLPKRAQIQSIVDVTGLPDFVDDSDTLKKRKEDTQKEFLVQPIGPRSLKEFLILSEKEALQPEPYTLPSGTIQNRDLIEHLKQIKTSSVSEPNASEDALNDSATATRY